MSEESSRHPLPALIESGWEYIGGGGYVLRGWMPRPVSDAELYDTFAEHMDEVFRNRIWPNGRDQPADWGPGCLSGIPEGGFK